MTQKKLNCNVIQSQVRYIYVPAQKKIKYLNLDDSSRAKCNSRYG